MDRPLITSIGLFIIDDIEFKDGRSKVSNVIGGAGTYAAIGARFFLPPPASKKACFIVDRGNDFPNEIQEEIDSWDSGVVYRDTPDRQTTRGWNKYGAKEVREFGYATPKKRIEVLDLLENDRLLQSQAFHLICSPLRCLDITTKLKAAININNKDYLVVWEPVPPECTPENFKHLPKVLKDVDILSPNAREGAAFFGEEEPETREEIEFLGTRLLSIMNPDAVLVIRCGARGACVFTREVTRWFPAYHDEQFGDHTVVDPTGGGNTFIGGFVAGYVQSNKDIVAAAVYGNVAAGLIVEQIGFPKVTKLDNGEAWNGTRVEDRVGTYRIRYDLF